MDDIKNIFAQNLITLRKQLKITQVEFAEKINYSDKAVSKWERGESIPDVCVLKSIGDFFGVTVDFLITEHTEDENAIPKTKLEKKATNKNRFLISGITLVAIFICMLTVYVALQSANPENIVVNVISCFVFPLPVCFLILTIFSSLWAKKIWKMFFVSGLIWSIIAVAFCIILIVTTRVVWLVFTIGIPAQIITLMSFGIIDLKALRKP